MKNLEKETIFCYEALVAIGIQPGKIISVEPNTRAKSRWGRCSMTTNGYKIEINADLLSDDVPDNALYNTLIHEMIHTYPGCMNHGKKWQAIAQKVNDEYGLNVKTRTTSAEKGFDQMYSARPPKYKVGCEKCGKFVYYRRRGDVVNCPELYCCSHCKGKLSVIQLRK